MLINIQRSSSVGYETERAILAVQSENETDNNQYLFAQRKLFM